MDALVTVGSRLQRDGTADVVHAGVGQPVESGDEQGERDAPDGVEVDR